MVPVVYYCYDAYCNWCYAFSTVIAQIANTFGNQVQFEVLSGGMIITSEPKPIEVMAGFFQANCKTVEEQTGARFGADYKWHIDHPGMSDWFPQSEKPAIALCIFKEYHPHRQIAFANDLLYALQYEGRDLCDDEAYRHLLTKYGIPAGEFYILLNSPAYKEKAWYEFDLCRQLKVTGFPALLMQVNESKFYMLASGYTPYETVRAQIEKALNNTI